MNALELITRSLRLINEPGRGATLAAADQTDGFTALQEILDSKAVSRAFVPGINRHFFPMVSGQAIYSYGSGPDRNLRSDDFGSLISGLGDPAPIKLEAAYIREGSTITNNELIDEFRFEAQGSWVLGTDVEITNNQLKIETPAAATDATQVLTVSTSVTYTLRVKAIINAGDVQIEARDSAVAIQTFLIDSSGFYSFDFTWPTNVAPDIRISAGDVTDDIRLDEISLIERGKRDRLELPDSQGSDYNMYIVDQAHYNRRFTKGTGGRPYNVLYSRGADQSGEIRFDNSAIAGDILVLDVLVNRVQVNSLVDEIRLNPSGILWLRHKLADVLAPEYGKALTLRQLKIMDEAWDSLATGNRRTNTLGVDRALRDRPTFDINRGDP
ncbi:MAG: hypothetical protein ACR2PR_08015 [Pseudohongiellaceae bacterium]